MGLSFIECKDRKLNMRSIGCAAIGVLAVVLLLMLTPHHAYLPKGIALPATQKSYPSVPVSQVNVYHQIPSADFQVVAQIRAEMGFQDPSSDSQNTLISYAKQLAAEQGANALVIRAIVPDDGVQKAYTLIADALRVPMQTSVTNGAQ